MQLLKKNKWLLADSICIAQGSATALNLMFETKEDHQLFFNLWERYLGDMTEIIHYHLSPTTWTILFKTNSTIDIERVYLHQRQKSQKALKQNTHREVKKMISEHFRIFISQFIRQSNRVLGRKGSKVIHRFKKCVLDKASDYNRIFLLLTRKERFKLQSNPKYRADESQYDKNNDMADDSILKSANAYYEAEDGRFGRFGQFRNFRNLEKKGNIGMKGQFGMKGKIVMGRIDWVVRGMRLLEPTSSVLRKYLSTHKIPNFHHPPPKS